MGASTSWNPQGLSRPVMGLLYLYMENVSVNGRIILKCILEKKV